MFTRRPRPRETPRRHGAMFARNSKRLACLACWRSTAEDGARRRAGAAPPAPTSAQQLRGPLPHLRAAVTSRGLLDEGRCRRTEAAQKCLGAIVPAIADE